MTDLARDHLALVLDVDDLDRALALADEVGEYFGVAKVGLELFTSAGPAAIGALAQRGYNVFADLKFHDIPNTVRQASRAIARLGVGYLNVHAAAGPDVVRAAVEGATRGAAEAGVAPPCVLAVTVLTSDPDASAFEARLEVALSAGCDGVVCSPLEVARVKQRRADFVTMVPGIRPVGAALDDQARVGTPGEAIAAGADVLVIGRAVSAAPDRRAAAAAVHAEVAAALTSIGRVR